MYDPSRDGGSKSVVIANPPFGAERDQPAYPNVWEEYSKESETTILFVKLMFDLLSSNKISQVKIPLPPLETQRQIVEKLDKQMQALEDVRLLKSEAEKRIEEILAGVWGEF